MSACLHTVSICLSLAIGNGCPPQTDASNEQGLSRFHNRRFIADPAILHEQPRNPRFVLRVPVLHARHASPSVAPSHPSGKLSEYREAATSSSVDAVRRVKTSDDALAAHDPPSRTRSPPARGPFLQSYQTHPPEHSSEQSNPPIHLSRYEPSDPVSILSASPPTACSFSNVYPPLRSTRLL